MDRQTETDVATSRAQALRDLTARPRFLRWALVNAMAFVAFVAALVAYHGHVHTVGKVSASIVLVVFALASAYCGLLSWRADEASERTDARALEHVSFAIRVCPMLAMLGTASGFLIAFTGSTEDVQQRVAGASTGIVATVVGVACTIVLMLQRHLLDEQ
jgi:ABC-type protease/lipase transport system fused ATPase/permease subunit